MKQYLFHYSLVRKIIGENIRSNTVKEWRGAMCGWYGGSLNKDSINLFKGAIKNLPKEKLIEIGI